MLNRHVGERSGASDAVASSVSTAYPHDLTPVECRCIRCSWQVARYHDAEAPSQLPAQYSGRGVLVLFSTLIGHSLTGIQRCSGTPPRVLRGPNSSVSVHPRSFPVVQDHHDQKSCIRHSEDTRHWQDRCTAPQLLSNSRSEAGQLLGSAASSQSLMIRRHHPSDCDLPL